MTDIFLDELVVADPFEIYLDEQTDAEPFSVYINEQTDTSDATELRDYIVATLDRLYLEDQDLETLTLGIYKDSTGALVGGISIKDYYYNYYGELQVVGNVTNLLLDLSNPLSYFLRTF